MKKQHENLHHRNSTTKITTNHIKQFKLKITKDNSSKQTYKIKYLTKYKLTINTNPNNKINIKVTITNNINQCLPTRKIITMINNNLPLNVQQHKLQSRPQQKYSGNHYVPTIQIKPKNNKDLRTLKNLTTHTISVLSNHPYFYAFF
jgi:hypothetical protein